MLVSLRMDFINIRATPELWVCLVQTCWFVCKVGNIKFNSGPVNVTHSIW